uniref:Calcium channel flower n=1 Tax=Parastrongyloides trichosuri TaxID=131310 RepID=A0A0N4Z660_PARTI
MGLAASAQTQMMTEHDPNSAFPWWIRFLAKGLGIAGGFIAMFFGMLALISVSPTCIIAALLQLVIGFLSIAIEAPFCCSFIDFIEKIAVFSESRAFWQKALLFCTMGIIPIIMCPEIDTILGSGMIFGCGTVYGFMALGKKADRNSMMAAAGGIDNQAWSPQVNQGPPV